MVDRWRCQSLLLLWKAGLCNPPSSFPSSAGWVTLRPTQCPPSPRPSLSSCCHFSQSCPASQLPSCPSTLRDTQQNLHSLWLQPRPESTGLGIKSSSSCCPCSALGHGHSCPDSILALVPAMLANPFNSISFFPLSHHLPGTPSQALFLLSCSHCHCFKGGHDLSSHRPERPTSLTSALPPVPTAC